MWWSGNQGGYGGIGVLEEEELNDKVARRVNGRVMSLVIVIEGEVARVVCAYPPQNINGIIS